MFHDAFASSRCGFLLKRWVSAVELRVLRYYKRVPWEKAGLAIVSELYSSEASSLAILVGQAMPVLFSPGELLNLWQQSRILKAHGGAFAEVGAFKGDSTEVICKAKGDRQFYIFEAFDGLPHPGGGIDRRFRRGLFASREQQLRHRVERYPNTKVIAGYFPETADCILQEKFSLVHVDVDLYESTYAAISFFYPRLLPGGRIIAHDYSQSEGVWRAVDDFLADKPETVEAMGTTQAVIAKR
jgi:O-methyltransferase